MKNRRKVKIAVFLFQLFVIVNAVISILFLMFLLWVFYTVLF